MSWIWLNDKTNPDIQNNYINVNSTDSEEREQYKYAVVRFEKTFEFKKEIKTINFKVSADSAYHLFINGEFTNIGPASPGGDFLCRKEYPHHFADVFAVDVSGNCFEIKADVKLLAEVLTEYSKGQGGFFCDIEFTDIDGKVISFSTDESWTAKQLTSYNNFESFDSTVAENPAENACIINDRWHLRDSEIPPVSLNNIFENEYLIPAGKEERIHIELDKIYGIIPCVSADGKCSVQLVTYELKGQETRTENITFGKEGEYVSFRMHSAGEADLTVKNDDEKEVKIIVRFIAPWYPILAEGSFECSDKEFNKVFDVCKHTLKICRQSIHLDSTKHQEHLACTGDYNIESLMTLFCFDDMGLAVSDIKKTADWIVENNGRMFHTTYSLIWVRMLKNVFMVTGDEKLLSYCEEAMEKLFSLFDTYFGESGVIETPPDYMFVDWTVIDGYSMHHPPKALGQTVLNAFWFDAVKCAADIYDYLGKPDKANSFRERAKLFKVAFNKEFFDEKKQLYFDGKTDKYSNTYNYLPENSDKIYYSKYPDILACAFGLADDAPALLERVIFNDEMQDIQPYFTHYLLIAIKECGLENKYAMKIFDRWKPVVADCEKGLAEGWIAPQPDYKFDHSHAWGGTVAYHLPAFVSGFEILEPGMKKISFSPNLLGLEDAKITMQTQHGTVSLEITADSFEVNAPDSIEVIIK